MVQFTALLVLIGSTEYSPQPPDSEGNSHQGQLTGLSQVGALLKRFLDTLKSSSSSISFSTTPLVTPIPLLSQGKLLPVGVVAIPLLLPPFSSFFFPGDETNISFDDLAAEVLRSGGRVRSSWVTADEVRSMTLSGLLPAVGQGSGMSIGRGSGMSIGVAGVVGTTWRWKLVESDEATTPPVKCWHLWPHSVHLFPPSFISQPHLHSKPQPHLHSYPTLPSVKISAPPSVKIPALPSFIFQPIVPVWASPPRD